MVRNIPPSRRGRLRGISAIVATVATASLLLGACSPSSSPGSSDPGGTAKEITVFLIPSPTEDAIKKRIPAFEQESGVKVNVVDAPYDNAHQKMLLSFQAKKGAYDVVQFDNPFLAPFASQGALEDLGPYTAKSTAYEISDFAKPLQDYNVYDGKAVALNLSTEPFILWYRKDIYAKLNLTVPKAWDEYLANAQKIQTSGLASGQVMANNSSVTAWWWLQLLWSFGGDLQDASGKATVDSPAAQQATDYMKSLLAVSPKSAITATGDDATTLFTTQDVGQMINYSGYYPVVTDPKSSKVIDKFGTAVIPVGTANITELTGWNIGIPADSKAKATSWQFLEWLLSKDNTPKLMDAGAAAIGRTSVVTNPAITEKAPHRTPRPGRPERSPTARSHQLGTGVQPDRRLGSRHSQRQDVNRGGISWPAIRPLRHLGPESMTATRQESRVADSSFAPTRKVHSGHASSAAYLAPGWVLLLGVVLIPLALGLWISFRDGSLLSSTSEFVALKNYANLLGSSAFFDAVKVTVVISVLSLAIQLPLGFLMAVAVNRDLLGTRVFRSSMLMPLLLTPVAVGLMWRLMLNVDNGVIDGVLQMLGMNPVDWLGDRTMAVVSVVLVDSWQNTPFVMLLMLAGLQSLPAGPLEAARIDRASVFQTYWHVILPLLAPVGLVVVMIRVIESVKLFDIIYILTSGGPGTATQNASVLDYRLGFTFLQTSQAAALGVLITIALIPVYRLWKKSNES